MPLARPSEFTVLFSEIRENIAEAKSLVLAQVADYASNQESETDWILTCASAAKKLDECSAQLSPIERHLIEIVTDVLGFDFDRESHSKTGLRQIEVEITAGMIRQNLLSLTSARKRGVVRIGEKFKIRLPDGASFETDLCEPGNKLRERGWVGHFYKTQGIGEGENVIVQETAPGEWELTREKSAASGVEHPNVQKDPAAP